MSKGFLKIAAGALAAVMLLAGCAEPVIFSEVFQLKEGEKIYTACNIWYEDAENIDCRNIQKGSFLPLGSEITPVEADAWSGKIVFKDKKGKIYTICFSEDYRLCTMADYIAYTFTTKSREKQLENVPGNIRSRILRGQVVPGMKTAHVQMAYGVPPAIRTPDLRNESWFYFLSPSDTVRVVFRGGIVRNVLNFNEQR